MFSFRSLGSVSRYVCSYVVFLGILLTACTPPQAPPEPKTQLNVVTLDGLEIRAGQTVYVPIYSHIYTWDRRRKMDLTATLSVRNTDLTRPLILTSVNYYDSSGQRIREYLEQPVEIESLASTNFVVDREDKSGGSGAAFVVEWVAQENISVPVIEAVMISTSSNQGISFVTSGRVIKDRTNASSE